MKVLLNRHSSRSDIEEGEHGILNAPEYVETKKDNSPRATYMICLCV